MLAKALLLLLLPQEPLARARAAEAERIAVMAVCAPAVCSVMSMDAPGGGSGVVFDPVGYVLTNYHVVGEPDDDWKPPVPPTASEAEQAVWRAEQLPQGARQYRHKKVGLPDGELYEAIVLGIDPGSDLAVLRLLPKRPGQTFPHRSLGDSDQLLVGEPVFAMGNPVSLATDFTPTVTYGIVSGTHRYQPGSGNRMLVYPDCIQVDAPVNPGNSGGPLFNQRGEVVGINGRISVGERGRVNVGVGFAIASNQIKNFLADLLAGRHTEHGTLDVSAWFMTAGPDGERRRGVFVQSLFRDSIAALAGLALGDELLRFDGIDIRSANQLATLVGVLPAGAWVEVGYRPQNSEGAFGEPRAFTVPLSRLDTGSSLDGAEPRLASRSERRAATAALAAAWPTRFAEAAACRWQCQGPAGTAIVATAAGDRLCLQLGDLALVRDGDRGGFARTKEGERDLTADEAERLRREALANPLLRPASGSRQPAGALLIGGVHVLGAPAYRFELPGDGECETWWFADGTPAGFTFRDPLQRAKVQWHLRGERVRVVVDGKLEAGWAGSAASVVPVDDKLFTRQR
jgi:S1-C subfamily serine protease